MKKLLLCSAAVCGLSFGAAADANAQIDLSVGGHTKNYVGWLDQDSSTGNDTHDIDILRESELHVKVEGTSDNGLTYGFMLEMNVDGGDATSIPEESYLYLSSGFGRVNIGSEDNAAYLLQVAAPSADANIDGFSPQIQPVNYAITDLGTNPRISYASRVAGHADEKITYLSPLMSGFQFGVSYTPDRGNAGGSGSDVLGFSQDDTAGDHGEVYSGAVRYEGEFDAVKFAIGAGYEKAVLEEDSGTSDDFKQWNVGLDIDLGAFGIGVAYLDGNNGQDNNDKDETLVVGVDYTTGPFQLGASWFNTEDNNIAGFTGNTIETDRYTGGVIYTAAPGLTFRGNVSYVTNDMPTGTSDVDATSVLGGVQFNF